jgi:hypothetical protein
MVHIFVSLNIFPAEAKRFGNGSEYARVVRCIAANGFINHLVIDSLQLPHKSECTRGEGLSDLFVSFFQGP